MVHFTVGPRYDVLSAERPFARQTMGIPLRFCIPACLAVAAFATGCRTSVDVTLSPVFDTKDVHELTVAVVDFDFQPSQSDTYSMGSYTRPENAGALVADMFAGELVRVGARVIERTRLKRLLEEQNLSNSDLLSDDHRMRIGRLLNANVIVVGTVGEFATAHWPGGQSGLVAFAVRGVDVESGQVLFSVIASDDRGLLDAPGVAASLVRDAGVRLRQKLRERSR